MAIYKPSDMRPMLSTIDVTEAPQFFSCLIDTNNVRVDSYSIVVLDENNNVIFPSQDLAISDKVTKISDLKIYCENNFRSEVSKYGSDVNTGYNGSYLVVPFITDVVAPFGSTVPRNQMTFGQMQNNMTYKWIITLYQGIVEGQNIRNYPASVQYFDMQVANGIVLGSTQNRIQTVPSDKIYKDYYIQLCHVNEPNFDSNNVDSWLTINNPDVQSVSKRVPVVSYDNEFGHIYPQENKLNITNGDPNAFQIYKFSNDPDDLTAYDKVDAFIDAAIDWTWHKKGSDEYGLYERAFGQDVEQADGYFPVLFVRDEIYGNIYIKNGQRLIINHQDAYYTEGDEKDEYDSSTGYGNHNGIFVPTITYQKESYKLTVEFRRAPDADTWGKLSNKIVYVNGSVQSYIPEWSTRVGQNVQIQYERWDSEDPSTFPKINETKFKFVEEKPIDIYSYDQSIIDINDRANDTGLIFFTRPDQIYIRPSYNIGEQMIWRNVSGSSDYFHISAVDTKYWWIKPDLIDLNRNLQPDVTRYQISSFYKASDESVFYTDKKPNITIYIDSTEISVLSVNVENRTFVASAEYEQENLHQWKSYQWILIDSNGDTVYIGEEKYAGEIKEEIFGLVAGEKYTLILKINGEDGNEYTKQVDVFADFTDSFVNDALVQISLDCNTGVVSIESDSIGVIVPEEHTVSNGSVVYSEDKAKLTKAYIEYDGIIADKDDDPSNTMPLMSNDNDDSYKIVFDTQIKTAQFSGDILTVSDENGTELFSAKLKDLTFVDRNGDIIATEEVEKMVINSVDYDVGIQSRLCTPIYQFKGWRTSVTHGGTDGANHADVAFEIIYEGDELIKNKYRTIKGPLNRYDLSVDSGNISVPFVTKNQISTGEDPTRGNEEFVMGQMNVDVASNSVGDLITTVFVSGESAVLDIDYYAKDRLVVDGQDINSSEYLTYHKNCMDKEDVFYDRDYVTINGENIALYDIDGDVINDLAGSGSPGSNVSGELIINGIAQDTVSSIALGANFTHSFIGLQPQESILIDEEVMVGQIHRTRSQYNNKNVSINTSLNGDWSVASANPVTVV